MKLKKKYLVLLTFVLLLLFLLLEMKHLMLVIQSKKKRKKKEEANKQTIYKHTNISDIENKIATIMINLLLLKNLISQH